MDATRRRFLRITGLAPLAAFAATRAQAADPACFDPATLPLAQKNRRRSIGYIDSSPDAARNCGRCAFFKPAASGCGACEMLGGGPVSVRGLCDAFAQAES